MDLVAGKHAMLMKNIALAKKGYRAVFQLTTHCYWPGAGSWGAVTNL